MEMPGEEYLAIPRGQALTELAGHYKTRDAYLICVGPQVLPSVVAALAALQDGDWIMYVDGGFPEVMRVAGRLELAALVACADEEHPGKMAVVFAVSKAVPAEELGKAMEKDVLPGQDVIAASTEELHERGLLAFPQLLVDAIGLVNPADHARLIMAQRGIVN